MSTWTLSADEADFLRWSGSARSIAPSAIGPDHRRSGSGASAVRSKLAAGLRGDDEVSLSMIEERDEQEQQIAEAAVEQERVSLGRSIGTKRKLTEPSQAQRAMQAMQAPSIPPPGAARRAPARSLASMPNSRMKPKVVMIGIRV